MFKRIKSYQIQRKSEGYVCSYCGKKVGEFPLRCSYCDKIVCYEHRLPIVHECKKFPTITLTPQEAAKRNRKGLTLARARPKTPDTNKIPRVYEVVGQRPTAKRQRLRKDKRKKTTESD